MTERRPEVASSRVATEDPDARPASLGSESDLRGIIRNRALVHAERPYLRCARSGRSLSFSELSRSVDWWDGWLGSQNIACGDRVAVHIFDPLDFATVFLAVMANHRWALPMDPAAPDRTTLAAIGRNRPAAVVSDRLGPPLQRTNIHWSQLDAIHRETPTSDGNGPRRPRFESPGGTVLATSGSTGEPKVISLGQGQLLHTARAVADHHGLTVADVGFNPLPLFHINAEVVGVLASLWAGAALVLDDRFHRASFWDLMERLGVTWINAVPTVINRLAPPGPGETVPGAVRFIRSASAPLPTAVLKRFEETTGVIVVETYGMTEAASQITANPMTGPRKPGSVGRPVGIELRVVVDSGSADPDGGTGRSYDSRPPVTAPPTEAAVGEPGHVEIRGPSVTLPSKALGAADRTATPGLGGGWLRTGDIGYLDTDGYLFLHGREDDVINRGGEKVYPGEIEDVLLEDPRITDAVVVGVDHEAFGQVPVAYVTVQGVGDKGDATRVFSVGGHAAHRLTGSLPRSKRPVTLHIVPALATTATGKVQRHGPGAARPGAILSLAV